MINFIIYEDEKEFRELYISVILKIIGSSNNAYKIIEIDKYDKNTISKIDKLVGKNIYILDIEVPGKSGLDLAREIRTNGDWQSQMIVVTSHEQMKTPTLTSKMLMLDFISKYYDMEKSLKDSIKLSLDILNSNRSLNFQFNGELYQIPYNDILFIEKNVDNQYSTIVTKNDNIETKKLIGTIENELIDDKRFFRTHRSCIVNLDNITSVELRDNIIHFGNKETNLLSREKKSELKQILGNKKEENSEELKICQNS